MRHYIDAVLKGCHFSGSFDIRICATAAAAATDRSAVVAAISQSYGPLADAITGTMA